MKKNYELLNSRIEKHLKSLIANGEFKEGDRLPPLREIAKKFTASIIPVMQATQKMAENGLVERVPGKGIFVRSSSPRTAATNRIGVLYWPPEVGFFNSSYYMAIVSGIEAQARSVKKTLLFRSFYQEGSGNPANMLYKMLDEVDGFILVDALPAIFVKIQKTLPNLKKPGVILHFEGTPDTIDSIVSDSRENTRKMMQFLIDQGHRRIACINNEPLAECKSPSFLKRIEAYRETLRQNGLPADETLVSGFDFRFSSLAYYNERSPASAPEYKSRLLEQFRKLLHSSPTPTALFCLSDEIAMHVYMMARKSNVRIPQDLSVVGYDNVRDVQFISPRLTTVHVPCFEMGMMGVNRLMEIVREKRNNLHIPCRTSLPGKIVARESHRAIG